VIECRTSNPEYMTVIKHPEMAFYASLTNARDVTRALKATTEVDILVLQEGT
jgi:hypothetical protein